VRGRAGAAVLALVAFAGCISYTGGARSVDPVRITEPGWIVAAPTPELRQPGARDCGAAALAMVARRWHDSLSVNGAIAALPTPTAQGTQLGDLRDAARTRGLIAFAISGDRDTLVHELRAGRPVIVGLLLPFGRDRVRSHYEVIVAMHPATNQFVTINPTSGWRIRSWVTLDAEWRPAHRPTLIVLGPAVAAHAP